VRTDVHIIADRFQRKLGINEALYASVPECMGAWSMHLDTSAMKIMRNAGGHSSGADRNTRSQNPKKQMTVRRLWTTALDVFD
jgi:hypothetical protein